MILLSRNISYSYRSFIKGLRQQMQYKARSIVWMFADIIQMASMIVLFRAVAKSGSADMIASEITTYYFLVLVISRFTLDWSVDIVTNTITSGEFSKYLLIPVNYLAEIFGKSLSVRVWRGMLIIPAILIILSVAHREIVIDTSFTTLLYTCISVILGYILNFVMGNTFALVAFYTKQVVGMTALYKNVQLILTGEYVPLSILPFVSGVGIVLLPFRYIISFPIEILMGKLDVSDIHLGLVTCIAWTIACWLLYRLLYSVAIKKFAGEGA